jgi:PadR family transcriptional regulator, regulatory protein PadR
VKAITDPSPKSDLPQGTLDLLILKVVAVEPVHGYAIAQRLQQISRDIVQVPGGSLYPALHRLENRGLLKSDWKETESGRDVKFYRLTRKGRAHLEAQTASWRRLAEAVGLILSLAEEGPDDLVVTLMAAQQTGARSRPRTRVSYCRKNLSRQEYRSE